VLLSIQGGSDLGLFEINEAAQLVANSAAPEANIIFGAVIDDALGDEVRVTVIAAGFDEANNRHARLARMNSGQSATSAASSGTGFRSSPFPDQSEPLAGAGQTTGPLAGAAASGGPGAFTAEAGTASPVTAGGAAHSAATHAAAEPAPPAGDSDGIPSPRPAQDAPRQGLDTASAARVFDAATTRRRSVVFEEDDELDVPDFLK
jgi:cell division protein FtsZ